MNTKFDFECSISIFVEYINLRVDLFHINGVDQNIKVQKRVLIRWWGGGLLNVVTESGTKITRGDAWYSPYCTIDKHTPENNANKSIKSGEKRQSLSILRLLLCPRSPRKKPSRYIAEGFV